jgi:hypothetical protein
MNRFLFAVFFLSTCTCNLWAQAATKTFHIAYDCREASAIDLTGLEGQVELRARGGSRILIEMNISMENGSMILLRNLLKEEHFAVEMAMESTTAKIKRKIFGKPKSYFATGPQDPIPGLPIIERVSYVVYVPPKQLPTVIISEAQKVH